MVIDITLILDININENFKTFVLKQKTKVFIFPSNTSALIEEKIDNNTIGILYEGDNGELYFLRIPVNEIIK